MTKDHREVEALRSLLETSQLLNSSRDLETILMTLMRESVALIPGADAGALFLYVPEEEVLQMRAYVNMGDSVADVKLAPGESMTGITFLARRALFFRTSEEVQRAMGTMAEPNKTMADDGQVVADQIQSAICCPLMSHGEPIGVVVVDRFRSDQPMVEEDVTLLEMIAEQATTAIVNSQVYEREIENGKRLEQQRNLYRYATHLHSELTTMILEGSSEEAIVKKVIALLGRPVFLIDGLGRVPFHGITDPGIRTGITRDLSRLMASLAGDPTRAALRVKAPYHPFPIMANGELMGWLVVIGEKTLSELEVITAERGASVLALLFLKQSEMLGLEQSIRGDFFDRLLEGRGDASVVASYRFSPEGRHQLVLVEISPTKRAEDERVRERRHRTALNDVYRKTENWLKSEAPGSFLATRNRRIAILQKVGDDPRKEVGMLHEMLVNNTVMEGFELSLGVSDAFEGIGTLRQHYDHAKQALQLGEGPLVFHGDFEVRKFLLANGTGELAAFHDKILGPLLTYGGTSGEDFLLTLSTYLRENGSWTKTKDRLHIHGNTLTYRLRRISDLLGMDLNRYEDRLKLQLALEIRSILAS
jgi:sugar diacid utilization regulator/putative methionine-R-sulfoxide reductase with GAF domain